MSEFHYGGQAVLEGVMIRGRKAMAVAVRAPSGEIVTHEEELSPAGRKWTRWPFLRGLYMLWDTMNLGMRALNFSANVSLGETEMQMGAGGMAVAITMGLALGIGLFFVLPLLLAQLLERVVAVSWIQVILETLLRLTIVILYFVLVGQMHDLKRVFAYHGAEHKVVHAYEAGLPLEVEEARRFTTAHTRCGTAFLVLVIVLSIAIFVPLGAFGLPFGWKIVSRILLVPVLAGLSYELIRLAARHEDHFLVRTILAPALLMQRLTTNPPDDDMLEVAIAAMKRALELDAQEPAVAEV